MTQDNQRWHNAEPQATWSILVHGGAGDVPEARRPEHAKGCAAAASIAARILFAGGGALEAVQAAVQALEDDEHFNAGTGGSLNADEHLELDASLMCGHSLRAGAVAALEGYKNPIAIARSALEHGEHVLYVAAGAAAFAAAQGHRATDPALMVTEAARQKLRAALSSGQAKNWAGGTVGAVARDVEGHVAAATSTGGTAGKRPGRVGDSPLIGAGTYADDALGACSATGYGEGILRAVTAYRALVRALELGPAESCGELIAELTRRWHAPAGLICATPDGRIGWARSTPSMSWGAAWQTEAARRAGASWTEAQVVSGF